MSLLPPIVEGRISNSFLSQIFLQLPLGKNFWWWKILKSLPLLLKKIPQISQISSQNIPSITSGEEFMVVENPKISSTIIKKNTTDNQKSFPNFFPKYSFNYLWEKILVVENHKISFSIVKKKYHRYSSLRMFTLAWKLQFLVKLESDKSCKVCKVWWASQQHN